MIKESNDDRRINMRMNVNTSMSLKKDKNKERNTANNVEVERNQIDGMKRVEGLNIWKNNEESDKYGKDEREYYGKKEKEDISNRLDVERKAREDEDEYKPDYQVYNFKDSGIGESWTLGNETGYGNAYIEGTDACPVDIIVPRSLTNKENVTKPVEVIGKYAYFGCGNPSYGDKTKTVLITKQVKVIKYNGLAYMYNVENFRFEEGSVLQSIESYGLISIGYNIIRDDESKRRTLTLPSTLSSVDSEGISFCNLFKIIIYCGTHSLTNPSELYDTEGVLEETIVRVTNQYSASTILSYTPLKDSPAEVFKECKIMEDRWDYNECNCSSPNSQNFPMLVLISTFLSIDKENESELLMYENRVYKKEEFTEGK